jgi:hypothetical protein
MGEWLQDDPLAPELGVEPEQQWPVESPEREFPDTDYLLAVESLRQSVLRVWPHCTAAEAAAILQGFEDEGYRWEFRK